MGPTYTHHYIRLLFSNCTTYETAVVQDVFLFLFLASKCSKCVNYHSKEQVEHDDDDKEEVQEVKHHPACKQRILK